MESKHECLPCKIEIEPSCKKGLTCLSTVFIAIAKVTNVFFPMKNLSSTRALSSLLAMIHAVIENYRSTVVDFGKYILNSMLLFFAKPFSNVANSF